MTSSVVIDEFILTPDACRTVFLYFVERIVNYSSRTKVFISIFLNAFNIYCTKSLTSTFNVLVLLPVICY